MKWQHLPLPGGLYDQDPQLLENFSFIFGEIAKKTAEEDEKREREMKKQQMASGNTTRTGRRYSRT
jgi:hypothetical protein